MTCVVGIEHKGDVYLGADSAGVAIENLSLVQRADAKVFANGPFVFGFTSSFRMGQLLRYAFTPPAKVENQDDMAYLVTSFVNEMRKCFKDKGFLQKTEGDQEFGGTFLLGYRGKLYTVDMDFQIARSDHPFAAVGCGAQVALGSLHTSERSRLESPAKCLQVALEAAERFSAGVRGPWTFVRLSKDGTSSVVE